MGRINTGGAKKRTGDNIALASSVSGTTLKLNPPKGYYDGVTGTVNVTDSDFVASKILEGINIFGIVGTSKPQPLTFQSVLKNVSAELLVEGNSFYDIQLFQDTTTSFQIDVTILATTGLTSSVYGQTNLGDGLNGCEADIQFAGATSGSIDICYLRSSAGSSKYGYLVSASGMKKPDGTWSVKSVYYSTNTGNFTEVTNENLSIVGTPKLRAFLLNNHNTSVAYAKYNFGATITYNQ